MAYSNCRGIVLREVRYKEADRILTIMTDTDGIVTAKAAGAVRSKSKNAAATQHLSYSEFVFSERAGKLYVKEAMAIEQFEGLRESISKLSLACYFSECIESTCLEGEAEPEALSLCLNALYALSRGLYSEIRIKSAFELRLSAILGYAPNLDACAVCGKDPEEAFLSISDGLVFCRDCIPGEMREMKYIGDCLEVMKYILKAPSKKFLAFKCEAGTEARLAEICEAFFLRHADRSFQTLTYWKNIKE